MDQRLRTLETCCGYEYDPTWKLSFPSDFQGTPVAHRTPRKSGCSPSNLTLSPYETIPGLFWLLTRKDNSSRGNGRRLRVRLRCRKISIFGFGNINPDSLSSINQSVITQKGKIVLFTRLIRDLGSINSWPTAVLKKPFSTSVFKVLTWIFATTTKICTIGRYTYPRGLSFVAFYWPTHTPTRRHRNSWRR